MPNKLEVVSYNILAQSYIKPQWYTRSQPETLTWEHRTNLLNKKLANLKADIMCLQEVEADIFESLEESLKKKSFSGIYYKKVNNKPDGCATFFRNDKLSLKNHHVLYYSDLAKGNINSGHLALILDFEIDGGVLSIANTHLKWDNKPKAQHLGYKQMSELLNTSIKKDNDADAWVICGDFNAQPHSFVIKELRKHDLKDAYANQEQATCNPNGKAKRIDYIFHTSNLASRAVQLPIIDDTTPLPSEVEPSDHLAIMASLIF